MPERTLPYNGVALARAGDRRADPEWIRTVRGRSDARAVLFREGRCVVDAQGDPVLVAAADLEREPVFLGLDGDAGVFAADLPAKDGADEPDGAGDAVDVRHLVATVAPQTAALLAYARGILHWHRNQRFCGACGGATESRDGGHVRACRTCGRLLFPRIEPAVIVLVEEPGSPERVLLGRHRGAATSAFSTLAGFVELGESLEEAVRREVAEEAGVRVGDVAYQASQTWPFPSGLMIGFRATALSHEIDVDHDELAEARWFTAAEVAALQAAHRADGTGRGDSIEEFLVGGWLSAVG